VHPLHWEARVLHRKTDQQRLEANRRTSRPRSCPLARTAEELRGWFYLQSHRPWPSHDLPVLRRRYGVLGNGLRKGGVSPGLLCRSGSPDFNDDSIGGCGGGREMLATVRFEAVQSMSIGWRAIRQRPLSSLRSTARSPIYVHAVGMEASFSTRPSDEDLALLWPKTPYTCWIGDDFVCRCDRCTTHRRWRWEEEEE